MTVVFYLTLLPRGLPRRKRNWQDQRSRPPSAGSWNFIFFVPNLFGIPTVPELPKHNHFSLQHNIGRPTVSLLNEAHLRNLKSLVKYQERSAFAKTSPAGASEPRERLLGRVLTSRGSR